MGAESEAELHVVVAGGVITAGEAHALAAEAAKDGQRLLDHLHAAGRISDPAFATLRAQAEAHVRDARTRDLARGKTTVRNINAEKTLSMELGPDGSPLRERNPVNLDDPNRFPVPDWDRYEPIRLLGQGGMGRVFLAKDLRLQRNVAIKFVRGNDPEDIRRVKAEARSQARVNDERVCKVFDVGEIEGRVYIAMQHIDGKRLTDLIDDLTIEEKVLVMRGAALGVNEAHRVGLIHRDLTPANIMIERGVDGELRPFVMDFGLARDWSTSHTMTGTVLGTPQFMAPEQARGEVKQLDRRADVYSLGATLYAVLTNHAPVEGGNALEILSKVSTVEPVRPRALVPDLPVDLEAIVLKCLEKDRGARYDSARALADDLDRFLAGLPVSARTVGRSYRLRKALRRHWQGIAATSIAVVIVGGALGFALRERQQASRREALARRFTEQVERIEAQARYAALAPIHDIAQDRAQIRTAMDALAAEINDEGDAALAPGHYALGRGYLALGDDAHAEAELRQAWALGFRDPRAAYALALALGHLYQYALRDIELLPAELRAARRAEVARRYRDPAREALRNSDGAEVPSREYVAALIAFYEGRLDDALHELDAIDSARLPWFYEAPLLRGEILRARVTASDGHAPPAQVAADLAAGRRAFAAAAAIGESDPAVHLALGELEYTAVRLQVYGGGEVTAPFTRGVEATGHALALVPQDVDALLLRARLSRRLAEHRGSRGEDASLLLAQAVGDAQRAVELAPARDDARFQLAQAYVQWGEDRQGRGEDPSEQLRKAVEVSDTVGAASRDATYYIHVGVLHTVWADYQDQHGEDSTRDRGLAIDAYTSAIKLSDSVGSAWLNLGNNYARRAASPRSADADADLRRAIDALEKGRALDPGGFAAAFYEGQAYARLADRQGARGEDPAPARARAIAMYELGLTVAPRASLLWNGISMVSTAQAKDAWARGDAPDLAHVRAITAATQAIAVAPDQAFGYNNLGVALLERAMSERSRGRDPRPAAGAAIAAFDRALGLMPDTPTILANLAAVRVVVAAAEVDRGVDPRAGLTLAQGEIGRALAQDPTFAPAVKLRAEVFATLARWQALSRPLTAGSFEAIAAAYREAIALDPTDLGAQLAFGGVCRRWADAALTAGVDPAAAIAEGLAVAERLCAARPQWSAACALRAGLRVARGKRRASTAAEQADAAQAAEELARYFASDRNLAQEWRVR
ncbi:MAG: serine/threonine protein kinase [Deltaproteobacteria bacterium]|nr:serine/threonine protein kinase [Deltaproteobacteria bacterium]